MKKCIALVLALVMALSLAACSGGTDSQQGGSAGASGGSAVSGGHVFGYTCMDLTNPFHIAMRDAMQEAVEANGDTFIGIDGQSDQLTQNDVIEDLITQGIEVLFLNPVDSASVQPALEACQAAGVKVINVDPAVQDRSLIETYIASNNVQAAASAARRSCACSRTAAIFALLRILWPRALYSGCRAWKRRWKAPTAPSWTASPSPPWTPC